MEGTSTPYRRLNYESDNEQCNNDIGCRNQSFDMDGRQLVGRELAPKIAMQFNTEADAYHCYLTYAKQVGFGIRRSKSYKDKSGKLICRLFVCSAEGKRIADKRDLYVRTPRAETRFGCEARMKVHSLKTGKFEVTEFVEDHNHVLSSPNKTHLHRSHRKISAVAAMNIEMANDVGIRPKQSHDLMVRQAGGRDNVGFIPDDYMNYLRSKRTGGMKRGDTGELFACLYKMQLQDPNFFYAIQVEEDGLMTNIFWCDGKMRNNYLNFGDVVCFDTTYKKNGEGRPLALFVGINHHKQTTIFGGTLFYDETVQTFEWLFETFQRAMSEKTPTTILTDQDAAMAKALASTWPNTHHRLCIWHIYQNVAIHLSGIFAKFKEFARDLSACIYEYEEEDEFYVAWAQMLEKYELQDNDWLKRLYGIKEKWALVYGRKIFCADMMTTQRSESMNRLLKRYVSYQHNVVKFFQHFQRLIDDRGYEELKADFKSNASKPTLSAPVKILTHASTVYTPEVFKWFQDEWNHCHDYSFTLSCENRIVEKYKITVPGKSYSQLVSYDLCNDDVHCSCGKFEFAGILCQHVLKVFSVKNISAIPTKYVMKRWTSKAKSWTSAQMESTVNYTNMDSCELPTIRYKDLCTLSMRLVTRAAERRDTYKVVKDKLLNMLKMVDESLHNEEIVDEKNQLP